MDQKCRSIGMQGLRTSTATCEAYDHFFEGTEEATLMMHISFTGVRILDIIPFEINSKHIKFGSSQRPLSLGNDSCHVRCPPPHAISQRE